VFRLILLVSPKQFIQYAQQIYKENDKNEKNAAGMRRGRPLFHEQCAWGIDASWKTMHAGNARSPVSQATKYASDSEVRSFGRL